MNRGHFYDVVRSHFGRFNQAQVDGYEATLAALDALEVSLITQRAYVLATFYHETAATLQPIAEYGTRDYIEARYDPVRASTPARRQRARRMGNTQPGDGWKYRGRGPVQVTWAINYRRVATLLGLDPDWARAHPEFMLDPQYAYRGSILGMQHGIFTGAKLDHYLSAQQTDYRNARRIVNGTDRAALIAGYARVFQSALEAAL